MAVSDGRQHLLEQRIHKLLGEKSKVMQEKPKDATPSMREPGAKGSSDESEDTYKTLDEFMEDLIVHHSRKLIPRDASPTDRRKAIQAILDDPKVRHRYVFSIWPRPPPIPDWRNVDMKSLDPRPYEFITPENSQPGKMAPNDLELWGATLFDFYHVQRIPGLENLRTTSTGSKLLRWCKANGEYEGDKAVARQCINWAEMEKDPELIPAYDIEKLIRNLEELAMDETTLPEHDSDAPMLVDETKDESRENSACGDCGNDVPSEVNEIDDRKGKEENQVEPYAPPVLPKSVFDKTTLPEIWRNVRPFCETGPWRFKSLPVLEEYISQSRLPETLVVHDPWKVLSVKSPSSAGQPTTVTEHRVMDDTYTVTYKLQLSKEHTQRFEAELKETLKKEKEHQQILEDFLANPHSQAKRPPGLEIPYLGDPFALKPAIYVVFPPAPRLACPDEAHLYLNPKEQIGTGHHSTVYLAEWEVQRSFLVREQLCISCVLEDVNAIVSEEDGEDGERRDPKWEELSGEIVLKEVKKPPYLMTVGFGSLAQDTNTYILEEGERDSYLLYEGPYRVIQTRVGYQNLECAPYCQHFAKSKKAAHPLTAKVRVAAKLSIEHDEHLEAEAMNYEKFPKHFFEHWSGYNIIPPIHEPTPVGPLVPQFYGYYVPVKNEERQAEMGKMNPEYLSPILLLEHCGTPITGIELSVDDRDECAALCFRMHEASWVHGSIYQRNILRKPGPLDAAPDERIKNSKKRKGYGENWSYRLIDFGRSGSGKEFDQEVVYECSNMKTSYSLFSPNQDLFK